MKDRIIKFLSENGLTSTKFADTIGVQRSSISHILSGRNKPSFDFIEKMLIAYPELDAQWLITGKGNMFSDQPSLFDQEIKQKSVDNLPSLESNIQNSVTDIAEKTKSEAEKQIQSEVTKKEHKVTNIERVIVFYRNGSFKEYKPE